MSFLDKFKKRQPKGKTTPATRRQRGRNTTDRGYVDSEGTFFLLDGSVPSDDLYSAPAVEDTSRTDNSSTRGSDYVTGGSEYSYHNRGHEPDSTPSHSSYDSGSYGGSSSSSSDSGSSSSGSSYDSGSSGGSSYGSSDSGGSYSSGGSDY